MQFSFTLAALVLWSRSRSQGRHHSRVASSSPGAPEDPLIKGAVAGCTCLVSLLISIPSVLCGRRKDSALPRYCGLSFREIVSRVGRNQTNVMLICDRWMQEGTTERRGRSHPPQCTTSREDRQTVRMAVTDRSVTSQTVAQHIESVTHHSVSARTIRRSLQQSGLTASRPLLGLPLTQNHRRLHRQ
ncbi:transposable element Tcb1 transposase [Trichonephila clavipes]|nr:transposable element Tcb1 transposase [Trichonephila clavipes]